MGALSACRAGGTKRLREVLNTFGRTFAIPAIALADPRIPVAREFALIVDPCLAR
jgi:hypothetical protein